MSFTPRFLSQLLQNTVSGDFPPFDGGTLTDTETYVRSVVGALKDLPNLRLDPDVYYNTNDPGGQWDNTWQSYVLVRLFRTDGPDHRDWSAMENRDPFAHNFPTEHNPDGLLLYICLLSPYWFYVAPHYTFRFIRDGVRYEVAGVSLPTPQTDFPIDDERWEAELKAIMEVLGWFQYRLLTHDEVMAEADVDPPLPVKLVRHPPRRQPAASKLKYSPISGQFFGPIIMKSDSIFSL
jgi:hypothetical protein